MLRTVFQVNQTQSMPGYSQPSRYYYVIYHAVSSMWQGPCIMCLGHLLCVMCAFVSCNLCNVLCAMCFAQSTMCYMPYIMCYGSCEMGHVLCVMSFVSCTLCLVLCVMYFVSCTLCHVLCILYFVSCTLCHLYYVANKMSQQSVNQLFNLFVS